MLSHPSRNGVNGIGLFRVGIRTSRGLAVDGDMSCRLIAFGIVLISLGLNAAQISVSIQQGLLKLTRLDQHKHLSSRISR